MQPSSRSWLPLLALVGVAIALGSGHVFARLALSNGVDVLTAATARSSAASLLLFALLRIRGIPLAASRPQLRSTLLLGLLITVQTLCIQAAVKLMPVTLAVLVFYTYPMFTGLAGNLLGSERLSGRMIGAMLAAFAGLALVLRVAAEPVNPLGLAAGLGASASFMAALVLTPRIAPQLVAPLRTFLMLSTAAVLLVAMASIAGGLHAPQRDAGLVGLVGLALCYAVGISVLFLVLPLLGPTQTAVVLNLEPVAVAFIAWGALGEALAPLQMAGAAIVVVAVIYFQTAARRRA